MSEDYARAWLALQSLHYQGEWARYSLTAPSALEARFRPLDARAAVEILVGYKGTHAPTFRRIAVAEVCRGSDSPTIGAEASDLINALAKQEPWSPHAVGNLHALLKVPNAGLRFEGALQAVLPPDCKLDGFEVDAKFCPTALLSDVEVRATLHRPPSELAPLSDPRLWATNYPNIWQRSDTVAAPEQFLDRGEDPPTEVHKTPQWSSYFFEQVSFMAFDGLPLTLAKLRNVLWVEFQSTPDSMQFEYRNVTCLSAKFPWLTPITFEGGIDHDSGVGSVAPAPGDPAKSAVVARKSIRFSQPSDARVAMNELTFANTILLLEYMLLLAACEHPLQ